MATPLIMAIIGRNALAEVTEQAFVLVCGLNSPLLSLSCPDYDAQSIRPLRSHHGREAMVIARLPR